MLVASYYYHHHLLLLLLLLAMDMECCEEEACKTTAGDSEEKMIMFELEAAEALVGLAYSAMPHQQQESPPAINYGSFSSPPQIPSQPPSTCDRPPHLPQDQAIVIKEPSEKVSNVITKTVKDEKNDEFKAGDLSSSASYFSIGGSKSRQPLTEIEKEARRLRRVLANRESARQTIRRRQAMFEELTRKVADLALENENLKKKKELAAKEYDSLKNTNDYLKKQIAKMVKPKSEEITQESNACSRTPFSPYTQTPIVPLHWPSVVQALDATLFQNRSPCDIANPSLFAMTHVSRPELLSDDREPAMVANPGALFYIMPFPCFCPLHSPTNALRPQSRPQNDGQNQTYSNNQCSASSSLKNSLHGEDDQACLSLKVKTEASSSTVSISVDDVHQAGFRYPPDGGGNIGGTYPDRMVLLPTPLRCVRPPTSLRVGCSTAARRNDTLTKEQVVASSTGQREKGASEDYQEPVVYSRKMSEDATTAAEARRRRKELMKLKIL